LFPYCIFKIYSAIRLSSRKPQVCNKLSVQKPQLSYYTVIYNHHHHHHLFCSHDTNKTSNMTIHEHDRQGYNALTAAPNYKSRQMLDRESGKMDE